MKRFHRTRVAPGTTYTVPRSEYDRTIPGWRVVGTEDRPFGAADEIGIHKGTVYASRMVGDRQLLRVARGTYDCHSDPEAIKPGDVYVELLYNGTRNTGGRYCIECAVKTGDALVNPPLVRWNTATRAWEPCTAQEAE